MNVGSGLYVERYEYQLEDFNIHYLCGWQCSDIIALAKKEHYSLYEAWWQLLRNTFPD